MSTLGCACLFATKGDALLLVRVRDNDRWYLPGGKIEANETAKEALCRELDEELSMSIAPTALDYVFTVEGPAYGRDGLVQLICFECKNAFEPYASGEISEMAWFDRKDYDAFAPIVQSLYDSWQAGDV